MRRGGGGKEEECKGEGEKEEGEREEKQGRRKKNSKGTERVLQFFHKTEIIPK